MSTPFRPIEIPPGVLTTATKKMRSSNYQEVNLIRWREGQLMPMGGHAQITNSTYSKNFAATAAFTTSSPNIPMAANDGTVMPGMNVYDTTNSQQIGTVKTFVGTALVLTANALHASSGAADTLQFTGENYKFASKCRRVHGWYDLNQVYHIAYLCESNLYIDTGGTLYDVSPVSPPLTAPGGLAGGFGDGPFNAEAFNTPRSIPTSVLVTKIPDCYSLDNFGGILYAMTSADGRLLMWDPNVGGAAVVQPPATGRGPVPNGTCFVVTQERFIMIFGSKNDGTAGGTSGGSFRRMAWCDQENPGAWDYASVTSQAGFLDIEPASPIICAEASRVGILFWTSKKVYSSRFLGLPYVYNYVELADGTTPWSPQSFSTTSSLTLWMSEQGVFSYDGTSILPVQCMVRPWVDDSIDPVMVREISFAVHVGDFNEWWWFFPTLNSPFNTRAIVYNYKEGWWAQAQLSRSAGITSSYTVYTIMADDYVAFQHDVYKAYAYANYNAPVVLPYAETFDLNLASGSRLSTVKQLIADVETVDAQDPTQIAAIIANLRYSVFYRNSRGLGTPELKSPQVAMRPDGYVDLRVTGRDVRLRIDVASAPTQPWTLGQHLIDSVPRGDR